MIVLFVIHVRRIPKLYCNYCRFSNLIKQNFGSSIIVIVFNDAWGGNHTGLRYSDRCIDNLRQRITQGGVIVILILTIYGRDTHRDQLQWSLHFLDNSILFILPEPPLPLIKLSLEMTGGSMLKLNNSIKLKGLIL